ADQLAWHQLAQRRGLKLVIQRLDRAGVSDSDAPASLIGPRTRLLAVSRLSNVLGTWDPVARLIALGKGQGALTVVGGSQGVVHG
ncbi:aminotransferase class V-fold PLP-dependent enzyme, partial [Pseudomonas syringae group genomosp. 7]|uniref:aminotransferase class V-fold PLP-dependent enzyme n=1 Tax=Pseudomonas syringae group genomosp. 7 TaxID=251699 RepID=UPI0037701C03